MYSTLRFKERSLDFKSRNVIRRKVAIWLFSLYRNSGDIYNAIRTSVTRIEDTQNFETGSKVYDTSALSMNFPLSLITFSHLNYVLGCIFSALSPYLSFCEHWSFVILLYISNVLV